MLSIPLHHPFFYLCSFWAAVKLHGVWKPSVSGYLQCVLVKRELLKLSLECVLFFIMEWGEQRNALIAPPTLSTSHPLIAPLFLSFNFPSSHFASFMCSQPSHISACSSRLAVCLCAQLWFLNSHICTYMWGSVYYCSDNKKNAIQPVHQYKHCLYGNKLKGPKNLNYLT